MAREYFCAYHSFLEDMEQLGDAERGRLFTALLEYSKTGTAPELRGNERILFPAMRGKIDRDRKKYDEKCEKNRQNGALGGKANATERMQTPPGRHQTPPNIEEKEKEEDKKEKSVKEKSGPSRFSPPTLSEISAYCRERKNNVDPQRFMDFYEAKGWFIGKNKMKDWKAAVRTWEAKDKRECSNNGSDIWNRRLGD